MKNLIINKRHELPLSKRLVWDIATILLWIGFIYLWKPLLHVFYRILTSTAPADEMSDWIYDNIHSVTFAHAIFMLTATPIVLFLLSRLNRHKSQSEHLIYKSNDYANYFQVNNKELQQCANSQFVTVHHDDHGHITSLSNQITKDTKITAK
ncbi:MAG: poly-beta-1,6-N-acetyl-D-glucosamine biosynthesis protein PgaD [Campylobacterales bacterium]|nr:poly-beta-1,6-N-acetyl-D-glucosamine biosynthesis protein PgaD [Campylobacterales bacterium]